MQRCSVIGESAVQWSDAERCRELTWLALAPTVWVVVGVEENDGVCVAVVVEELVSLLVAVVLLLAVSVPDAEAVAVADADDVSEDVRD